MRSFVLPAIGLLLLLIPGDARLKTGSIPAQQEQHDQDQRRRRQAQVSELMVKFQRARAKFKTKVDSQYGKYADGFFWDTIDVNGTATRIPASRFMFQDMDKNGKLGDTSTLSWHRLKRKMMIRILQGMIETTAKPKFIWASGGHSSAAGHGNLFSESFTMVLGENMKESFEAIGLEFEVRPFAMGATSSGPEVSSCFKEIFGNDADFYAWDYGMTTAQHVEQLEHWLHRGALTPSRPAFLAYSHSRYKPPVKAIVEMGFAGFFFDFAKKDKLLKEVPPDCTGMSEQQLNALPPMVAGLRCDSSIEKGNPCQSMKFSIDPDAEEGCNHRRHQQHWHPGFKVHTLFGNYMSLFLMEAMDEALRALNIDASDAQTLLNSLLKEQEDDYKLFEDKYEIKWGYQEMTKDIPQDVVFRKPNYCHHARLPAQIRYSGILTDSPAGNFLNVSSFDQGTLDTKEFIFEQPHESVELVYNSGIRQSKCKKHVLQIDYRDYFLVATHLATSKLVLPTESEIKAYGDYTKELQGLISVCAVKVVKAMHFANQQIDIVDGVEKGSVAITVNGIPVTALTTYSEAEPCWWLKHKGGYRFKKQNDRFSFAFSTTVEEQKMVRLTSIIIW